MKKSLLILLALVLSPNLYAQTTNWVTVKDLERGFRVDFPSQPTSQTQVVPSAAGDLQMESTMLDLSANADADILIYMTAFTKYPSDYTDYEDESNIDKMLNGTVNGAVSNVNGELLTASKCEFNNYKCMEAKIGIQSGAYIIHMKSILVGSDLYLLQTIYAREDDKNANDKKFFDSFELIKVK